MTRTASPNELGKAEHNEARSAAVQPRHPGPVPAGLDLQGGDRRRRRSTAARSPPKRRSTRPGSIDDEGPAAGQRLQRRTRADHPRHGADQLGQHLVRPARRTGRRGHPVRIHGTVRLRLEAADRPALRPALASGVFDSKTARCSTRDDPIDIARVAIGQERLLVTPLQMAEVAAAVANSGHADEAPDLEQGRRPRRPRRQSDSTPPNTASRSASRRRPS